MQRQCETRGRRRGQRALGTLTVALALGWSIVIAYAVHAGMPFNPVTLPAEDRMATRTILPEGWGFFTRDPREERILPFHKSEGGDWVSASLAPHARPSNGFGLDRMSRAQGIELGLLLENLAESAWSPCSERPAACLEKTSALTPLKNESPRPTLCGHVGLALQKPVPWAWASSRNRIVMPSRVLRLEVSCE